MTTFFKETMRLYDRYRLEAEALLKKRTGEVYEKCPRIKEIDEELAFLSLNAAKAMIESKADRREIGLSFREKSRALGEEREQLLKKFKIPERYLTDVYRCNACADTGYIENQKCKCLKQNLIKQYYTGANLSDTFKHENFDSFDLNYYSDEVDKQYGVSPKSNMKWIWMTCLNFVKDFDKIHKNLLLSGTCGTGKTFLCNSIAKEILESGHTVFYSTSSQLFKTVEDLRFNRKDDGEQEDFLAMVMEVDLLIIDDLGTEFMSVVTASELFNIINTRLLFSRSTIISTNLSSTELLNQYSERVTSRLVGDYTLLKFFGDDIRTKKKYGLQ